MSGENGLNKHRLAGKSLSEVHQLASKLLNQRSEVRQTEMAIFYVRISVNLMIRANWTTTWTKISIRQFYRRTELDWAGCGSIHSLMDRIRWLAVLPFKATLHWTRTLFARWVPSGSHLIGLLAQDPSIESVHCFDSLTVLWRSLDAFFCIRFELLILKTLKTKTTSNQY